VYIEAKEMRIFA